MNRLGFKILFFSGLTALYRALTQKKKLSILLWHDPDPKGFEAALAYLGQHYNFVSFEDYRQFRKGAAKLPDYPMILTFDDGHQRNYDLLEAFKKHQCRATIFLCSGIIGTKRAYWFNKELPRDFKRRCKKMTNQERLEALKDYGYNKEGEAGHRQALNEDELKQLEPHLELEAHTRFHPILPSCSNEEAQDEIINCRKELKEKFNLETTVFAYPNGDYSDRDISLCQEAGYSMAVTVEPGLNDGNTKPFELKRLSVNDSTWIPELAVRSSSLWSKIKKQTSRKTQPWGS